jgi:hypothetical protein
MLLRNGKIIGYNIKPLKFPTKIIVNNSDYKFPLNGVYYKLKNKNKYIMLNCPYKFEICLNTQTYEWDILSAWHGAIFYKSLYNYGIPPEHPNCWISSINGKSLPTITYEFS